MDYLPTAIPTARQLEFQDWEFGIFLHFGIRTFYEGHRDWDGKAMPVEGFAPTDFSAEQWARVASEAGARYMVLVAKHHDGFANWPSEYSTYSVGQSPWRDGQGDVVREFVDACRAYDLKVGLYYSPAEWGSPVFEDARAYDDHFIAQASELLGNYGEVDMLWFDGCGSEGHTYDWRRIIGEIRRLQPDLLIFNMGDPDYRWIGNELGIAPLPTYCTATTVPFSVKTDEVESVGEEARWLPGECDCRIRLRNWFYSDADVDTVKSVDELMGLYYLSVGRGCNLLLNIAPDRAGRLPEPDATRVVAFGQEVQRRFAEPVATLEDVVVGDGCWELRADEEILVDHLVLEEELENGEHVRRFEVLLVCHGQELLLHAGYQIGHKAICRFAPVPVGHLVVRVVEADGPVRLKGLSAYMVGA